MLVDVVRDEGTERHDLEPVAGSVVEHGADELAAEAAAGAGRVDLGVREDEAAVPAAVRGEADQAAVEA